MMRPFYTLVPAKIMVNDKGKVKVEICLVRGKKAYEIREAIRKRDREREMRVQLKRWR